MKSQHCPSVLVTLACFLFIALATPAASACTDTGPASNETGCFVNTTYAVTHRPLKRHLIPICVSRGNGSVSTLKVTLNPAATTTGKPLTFVLDHTRYNGAESADVICYHIVANKPGSTTFGVLSANTTLPVPAGVHNATIVYDLVVGGVVSRSAPSTVTVAASSDCDVGLETCSATEEGYSDHAFAVAVGTAAAVGLAVGVFCGIAFTVWKKNGFKPVPF